MTASEVLGQVRQREFFLLGPHSPNLTTNEVNLVHQLWLKFSDSLSSEELHHHDIVHFALNELQKELSEGKENDVATRLRAHLHENKVRRIPKQ